MAIGSVTAGIGSQETCKSYGEYEQPASPATNGGSTALRRMRSYLNMTEGRSWGTPRHVGTALVP